MEDNRILINPRLIFRGLLFIATVLVIISIGGQMIKYITGHRSLFGLIPLTYVDLEENIPTFFSVFLLLLSALLLFIIIILKRKESDSKILFWAVLFCGFVYLAVDEAWMIHEFLIEPVKNLFGVGDIGIFAVAWVLPGMAVVILLAIFFIRFLLSLPKKTRLTFIYSASLFIGGAIIIESVSGAYAAKSGITYENQNFIYSMIATLEEMLEMGGIILFIKALLDYIGNSYNIIYFQVGERNH